MKLAKDPGVGFTRRKVAQRGPLCWERSSIPGVLQATLKRFPVEEFISEDLFGFCMGTRSEGYKLEGRELLTHEAMQGTVCEVVGTPVAAYKSQPCV